MDPFTIAAIGGGLLSAYQGNKAQGRADKLAAKQLAFDAQRWKLGEPLRNMGLQGLGRAFQPMDMGNHMYDAANPYAAARGPRPSNATLGNMGDIGFTLPPNFEQQTRETMAQDAFSNRADEYARMDGAVGDMGRKLQAEIRRRLPGARSGYQPVGYGWEG